MEVAKQSSRHQFGVAREQSGLVFTSTTSPIQVNSWTPDEKRSSRRVAFLFQRKHLRNIGCCEREGERGDPFALCRAGWRGWGRSRLKHGSARSGVRTLRACSSNVQPRSDTGVTESVSAALQRVSGALTQPPLPRNTSWKRQSP
ncbi:hypothetical protein Y1Q_0015790 [Alligator mississippiensis]|uniref:Uncharacterized protein n=1 Tax=Alligator mississippiensis TaxID=8496 RepID=A0A151M3S9_ALLMI|nr:hypothetical protein Y1Q_0015790 [Alligator mississippiensis]